MSQEQFKKMQDFIDGAPWLQLENKVKCPKCGFEDETTYEGFESFFV